MRDAGSPEEGDADDRHSSLRLEVTLAVGYQRHRSVLGGAIEGHIVTVLLLIIGGSVVILFVWVIARWIMGLL